MLQEISVEELKEMRDSGEDFVLIDVREPHERAIAEIGGKHIPLQTVPQNLQEFMADKKVVVLCRSGVRSAKAIEFVRQQTGRDNLYNLKGGILAWAEKIDPSLRKY